NAPAPGAKPGRKKKAATDSESAGSAKELEAPSEGIDGSESEDTPAPVKPSTQSPDKSAAQNGAINRTPRPGARPKKRKR
ncbi:membrane protein insertase YidC, partial [Mycobacterium sp. ITM-2017-0098]